MIDIKKLTIEEKVGQMMGFAFYGTEYSEELRMQIEDIQVGLVIYFKDNCDNPRQIFNLNKIINERSKIPPFISLDQEGGMVARVTEGIVQSPGAMAISACEKPEYAYKLAYNMGKDMVKLGFNFNFAPVGDINNNPLNPVINVRSYSEDPEVVCTYVKEAVKGYHDAGMMTSIKHFPGHGDTLVDTHLGLAKVDFDRERLYNIELKPFLLAKEENLPGIMAAHVMYTKYDDEFPTTMSHKVITGLLREEIGYDGLVVTDSLTMKAVFDNFSLEELKAVLGDVAYEPALKDSREVPKSPGMKYRHYAPTGQLYLVEPNHEDTLAEKLEGQSTTIKADTEEDIIFRNYVNLILHFDSELFVLAKLQLANNKKADTIFNINLAMNKNYKDSIL